MATRKAKKKPIARAASKKTAAKVKAKAPKQVSPRRTIAARFDATRRGHENENHWGDADWLGPNSSNSQAVRAELARRARLERENNPHVFGMAKTFAYSFVGTGPRLQLALEGRYESTRKFEQLVSGWMRAINFTEKLHLMVGCCPVDGETFGQIIENPAVEHPLKIDVRVMEQEQVQTPGFDSWANPGAISGLVLDDYGNVTHYHVLHEHPGDAVSFDMGYETVPARFMLHWFRPYRPSQARGVSELASSIEICAQSRRYAKATLSKQELNANIAGVIESENISIDSSDAPTFETMEEIDIPRAGLMTMPGGMKAKPFETAQNTTGFKEYMEMNYSAMGRPLGLPRNLITNDSSGFNFASGRMDHLPYQDMTWVDRDRCRNRILDKLLKVLYAEAKLKGLVPADLPPMSEWIWDWHWDGFPSIDAVKDETAAEMKVKNGKATLSELNAADGKDWREVARQIAIEVKYFKSLGLIHPYEAAMMAAMPPKPAAPSASAADDESEIDTTLDRAEASYELDLMLKASAAPTEMKICGDSEPLDIQAGDKPDGPKKFAMTAYTGAAINVGFGYPVVVDLAGMNVPSQSRPILRNHDAERIVGHSTAIEKTPQRLKVAGVLSGLDEHVAAIVATAGKGFPWQASIGASIQKMEFVDTGDTVKVNGRNFDGPIYVARATTLGEVSFVPLGADGATSATVAASKLKEQVMTFDEWLKAKNIEANGLTDALMAVLKAQYKAEQLPVTPKAEPQVQAAAPKAEQSATKTLDDVIQAQRAENARTEGITAAVARVAGEQPHKLDAFEAIGRQAIEGKWSVETTEMKLMLESLRAGGSPSVFSINKPAVNAEVIEAGIYIASGMSNPEKHFSEQTLNAADKNFGHSLGLQEVISICANARGYRGNVRRDLPGALKAAFYGDLRASVTSSVLSIDGILSNVANKFVREAFMYVENQYEKISTTRSVRDFKQISSYSLTGDLTYDLVAPGGEIKHGTLGDETYNNQAKTYGKLLGISRTDLINDDLGALSTVSKRLGRGGALKLNDVFWTAFMDNSSFFTTGNGNYDDGTDTALTNDGLAAADILWRAMTDPDGKIMGGKAKYLLVPANHAITAWRLMNSPRFTSADEEGEMNPWAGMFEVVVSDYLNNSAYTGYSTKAWYLLRDPNDIPVIEVCYLNGQKMPTIETADLDFDRLGIALRGYHDFGVAKQEPRGGYKFKGEA